jgi:hypothetical protein
MKISSEENNATVPVKDRFFIKLIDILFSIMYDYFDPADIKSTFSININHYKKVDNKERQ